MTPYRIFFGFKTDEEEKKRSELDQVEEEYR